MADRISEDVLAAKLAECPPPGLYQYRRTGAEVRVIGAAIREDDLSPQVVYRHGRVTWTRPAAEFLNRFDLLIPDGEE